MFTHRLALLLTLAIPLAAQQTEPSLWSGSGEISYVSTSGNTDTSTLGTAFDLLYQPRPVWSAELKAAFVDSENQGEQTARALTALLGVNRDLRETLTTYARAAYLQNRFAGIDRRLTYEAGLGWDVIETDRQALRLEAGLGHTQEERIDSPDVSFASGRTGANYRWNFSETSSFNEELSLLMNLESGGDYRILNVASIQAGLTSIFSLKVSHALSYVAEPVPGFESTDAVISAAIVAKFGNP